MILDTLVLLAISFREQGFERLVQELTDADAVAVGTPTLAEAGIVLTARPKPWLPSAASDRAGTRRA